MQAWTLKNTIKQAGFLKGFKFLVFFLALIPLERLIYFAYSDQLGANPIEFITRSTGTWTLVLFCLTLGMTPLRLITGWGGWIRVRRMLGLFVFFYACLHFLIWLWQILAFFSATTCTKSTSSQEMFSKSPDLIFCRQLFTFTLNQSNGLFQKSRPIFESQCLSFKQSFSSSLN